MYIKTAFDVKEGNVVTLVGGGGKTTTMLKITQEFSDKKHTVIVTTTTKIRVSEGKSTDQLLIVKDIDDFRKKFDKMKRKTITLASGFTGNNKLSGFYPDLINKLVKFKKSPLILVEGDGANSRPFKAPAEHEPVIPSSTNLVIPVVGVDIVGKRLNSENVHRPEIVSKLAGAKIGEPVEPDLIARILTHEKGGLKSVPPKARVIPLLNKVEDRKDESLSEIIAEKILDLAKNKIKKVAVGNVHEEDPIKRMIQ